MAFAFREVTISGGRNDTEGTSKALNEIRDVLLNEMGWVEEDDRRTQAGSSNVANTHKVVFNSDGGEDGTGPNWFLTVTSGTTAAVATDVLGIQVASAYDVGTHDTAGSGVEIPVAHSTITLNSDSDGYFNLWISGDKDSVVFLANPRNDYRFVIAGRGLHFLDDNAEPFGLYLHGSSNTNPLSSSIRSIVGSPPVALAGTNEGEFIAPGLLIGNEPRIGLGQDEAIFTILPITHMVDDTSPVRKGAIGVVRNMWVGVTQNAGWIKESLLTISGSSQTYLAFPQTTTSLVIRKS